MRTVTIYRTNKSTGEVEKKEVERFNLGVSYDAGMDKPMPQRILDAYYKLECEGKLNGPTDLIGSKSFTKKIWETVAARTS